MYRHFSHTISLRILKCYSWRLSFLTYFVVGKGTHRSVIWCFDLCGNDMQANIESETVFLRVINFMRWNWKIDRQSSLKWFPINKRFNLNECRFFSISGIETWAEQIAATIDPYRRAWNIILSQVSLFLTSILIAHKSGRTKRHVNSIWGS